MILLLVLAGLWLIIATIQDLRKREVANWVSFSLIAFSLVYRAFVSIFLFNYWVLIYGLLGLAIFVGLGYAFYYGRIFAGGDAKLLMSLGGVLPLSSVGLFSGLVDNLKIFLAFLLLVLLVGSIYGLAYSFILVLRNKKNFVREFRRQFKTRKIIFYSSIVFALLSFVFVFYAGDLILIAFPILFLAFPLLYMYAKSVEEACMIKAVRSKEVTVGDWLYENVKIGKKVIKPYWEGLDEKEVKLLRKYNKKIKIKVGIPFVPVFLIAFLLFVILWYSSWSFFNLF